MTDFGISKMIIEEENEVFNINQSESLKGSVYYLPPEILNNSEYMTKSIDYW